MVFQSTVRIDQTTGIVGDIILDGPQRGQPAILRSTSAANNVIGRGFTLVSGTDNVVTAGGSGTFMGILAHSKHYASDGKAVSRQNRLTALPFIGGTADFPHFFIIYNRLTALPFVGVKLLFCKHFPNPTIHFTGIFVLFCSAD